MEDLDAWIGREEERTDAARPEPLRRLSALLDHDTAPWIVGEVPPLGHWLYFLPEARQSRLGADGHPRRGGLLPPVPLPRRMWAGGRLTFHAPVVFGASLRRRSVVTGIDRKQGRLGELVFVTLRHEISGDDALLIEEEQDIVYRAAAAGAVAPRAERPAPAAGFDAVQLFRFSALTFNGHRIHFDRDYATRVEHYPGLVVQGPFVATLLMDHYLRAHPGARIVRFRFEARRSLFEGDPFAPMREELPDGAELSAMAPDGSPAMTAEVRCA